MQLTLHDITSDFCAIGRNTGQKIRTCHFFVSGWDMPPESSGAAFLLHRRTAVLPPQPASSLTAQP